MQLAPGVRLVASGSGGFDLTDPLDCHIYLVDGEGDEEAMSLEAGKRADGRRALFAGDLLFYGGRISLENTWDCRMQDYAANRQFERGFVPPSVV